MFNIISVCMLYELSHTPKSNCSHWFYCRTLHCDLQFYTDIFPTLLISTLNDVMINDRWCCITISFGTIIYCHIKVRTLQCHMCLCVSVQPCYTIIIWSLQPFSYNNIWLLSSQRLFIPVVGIIENICQSISSYIINHKTCEWLLYRRTICWNQYTRSSLNKVLRFIKRRNRFYYNLFDYRHKAFFSARERERDTRR